MNRAAVSGATSALLLLLNVSAFANDVVKFPTGPAAWTVAVEPSQTAGSSAPPPKDQNHIVSMAVTQDAEKRRIVVTWSSGETFERWEIYHFNLLLSQDPLGHVFAVVNTGNQAGIMAIPFVPKSFSWVNRSFLQEKAPIDYQGKQCYHYQGNISRAILSGNNFNKGTAIAAVWIDSQTLLPVAFDDGTGLATYTFQKDPPPPLTMPQKYQDAYTRYKAAIGIMNPVILPPPPSH